MRPLKQHPIPFIALTLLLAMTIACGGTAGAPSEDDTPAETAAADASEPSAAEPTAEPEPTGTPHPTATEVPLTATPEPAAGSGTGSDIESSMTGTWKSVCMDIGSGSYIIITLVFDGAGGGYDVTNFYSDSGCTTATGLVKTSQTRYALGGSSIISEKNAYEIDITINSWELTQDGDVVTSGTNEPTQYDVVAVEGTTLFTSGLTRADPGPILTPDDRPTTLDLANFYTRQ
jgi:hypothetical protein